MTSPHPHTPDAARWWRTLDVAVGDTQHCRIGPLGLWIQRSRGEWRIAQSRLTDPLHPTVEMARPSAPDRVPADARVDRFAVPGDSPRLRVAPRLADRSVVSRPDQPFHVPAGEEAVLFVGSPLWVALSTEEPAHTLLDTPAFRPSDTWFGPTHHDGELCYASTTYCHLRSEDVPFRPHRCVTAVTIRHRTDHNLALDRVRLPVDALALYADADGRMWTQDVTFTREEVGEHAELTIGKHAPAHAREPERLADARVPPQENLVMRAFSALFA